jgi:hypothetical protein
MPQSNPTQHNNKNKKIENALVNGQNFGEGHFKNHIIIVYCKQFLL